MENLKIFDMNLKDYDEIKDILISDFDDFWSPEVLKSELTGENKIYIVAKIEKEIVGFCGIMINFDEIEIMNIVVRKSYRRKGVGKTLLNEIIKKSEDFNCKNIFLEVNEKNIPAIKMYGDIGFKQVGRRKKYYNNKYDAIIMSKK